MTPSTRGNYSLGGYMTGLSMEKVQKERDELLAVSAETIRGLSQYVKAFMEEDFLCVVGNGEKIRENKDLFLNVDQLFH